MAPATTAADTLVLRADAGDRTGTGHAMRCLALAEAWRGTGREAVLAAARLPPGLRDRYEASGVPVHDLDVDPGSPDDAKATADLARTAASDGGPVAVDGYHLDAAYVEALVEAGCRVLRIDDLGEPPGPADVLLNQNLHADASMYPGFDGELLLGPHYALLRSEFRRARGAAPAAGDGAGAGADRADDLSGSGGSGGTDNAVRVLVTLGGSDPDRVTERAVEALGRLDDPRLRVRVVCGPDYPDPDGLADRVADLPADARLERDVASMADPMAWADVAVSGAGSTVWELLHMGVPPVMLTLADNQRPIAAAVAEAGAGVDAGWGPDADPADVAEVLRELLDDGDRRRAMADRGRGLVDGYGADRVAMVLAGDRVRLRPVGPDDVEMIWEWANDEEARRWSFHPEPIPWEEHTAWFRRKLDDPDCRFHVAVDEDDADVGQVRIDLGDGDGTISVSVAPEQRGRGLGPEIIRLASRRALHRTSAGVVHAYIKPANEASIKAFRRAGFREDGETRVEGETALRFAMRSEDGT